jgi:hypothetical protein
MPSISISSRKQNISFKLYKADDYERKEWMIPNADIPNRLDATLADPSDVTAMVFPYVQPPSGDSFHMPGSKVIWVRYRFADPSAFVTGCNVSEEPTALNKRPAMLKKGLLIDEETIGWIYKVSTPPAKKQ